MKKGQGLSLNTIIIAAIVLIVLIVLWAIFTGRMGKFTAGVKTEEERATEAAEDFEKIASLPICSEIIQGPDECVCGSKVCMGTGAPCGPNDECPS